MIVAILIGWNQILLAQYNGEVIRYSLEEGLPSRQVLGVASDDDGFLWLATPGGLSRFDGYDFLNFDTTNTSGMTDQHILSLAVSDSVLWLGTLSGIFTFNLNTYEISKILGDVGEVRELYVDGAGRLWFTNHRGNVNTIDGDNVRQVQTHYNRPWTNSIINHVTSFGDDDDGVWWGRLDGSIYYYQHKTETLETLLDGSIIKKRGKPMPLTDSTTIIFSNEAAWTHNIHNKTSRVISHEVKGRGKISTIVDKNSLLHVDGENNVFEVSLSTSTVTHNPYLTEILSSTAGVNKLLVGQNVWWVATNSGLIKLKRRVQLFQRVLNDKSASVRSIHPYQQGKSFVSTYQGFYYLDQGHQVEYWSNYPYKIIYDYFEDENGVLWALEENRGLMKLNSSLREFENVLTEDDSLGYASALLHQDKIYVGSQTGLYQFDLSSEKMTPVQDSISGIDLESNVIFDLIVEDGKLWIGTGTGLYQLDLTTGSIEDIDSLNGIPIRDIYSTKDGTLWLGTGGMGVIAFETSSKEMYRYDHNNGLNNNTINLIISSHQGTVIWVGTNNGLSCIDRQSGTLINYFEEDGIAHNEFNRKAASRDNEGNIWMGGLNGITVFDPNKFTISETNPPKLLLTGVGKYNGATDKVQFNAEGLTNQRAFSYKPNDRLFRFRFALSDFENSDKNRFRYKIDGLHQEWVDLSNQHELLVDNLSPGEYRLEIVGTNGKGVWSQPLQLVLSVDYAYYQTPWFYLLILVGFIMIGVFIHRIRVAQLLKVERVRNKIARDLHDELGSSLTRISMYSEIAKENSDSKDTLEEVASLSRDAASTLSDIVWSIDNTDDRLGSLLDRIKDHLFLMVDNSELEPNFFSENVREDLVLKAEVKQHVFLISKEAINNSVKYSNGNILSVSVILESGCLKVNVSDNGNINKDREGKTTKGGNGLRNMRKRAQQIGGILEISEDDGFSVLLSVNI